jgi:hypothetical protein
MNVRKQVIDTKSFIRHPEEFEIKVALVADIVKGTENGLFFASYRHGDMPGAEMVDSLQGPDSKTVRVQKVVDLQKDDTVRDWYKKQNIRPNEEEFGCGGGMGIE